jgi:hypothetical protein
LGRIVALDETWLKWNPMLRGIQLRFQPHGVTVDLLRPRDEHDQQLFRRKRKRSIDGRYYWFVSPEDFIIQKLKVGRPRDLRTPFRFCSDPEKLWIVDTSNDGPIESGCRRNSNTFSRFELRMI